MDFFNVDTDRILNIISNLGTYCDIRINCGKSSNIILKDGKIEEISTGSSIGATVRVLYKNGWGYATTNNISVDEIEKMVNKAYTAGKMVNEVSKKDIILSESEVYKDNVIINCKIDPNDVPIEDKKELLLDVHKKISEDDRIVSTSIMYGEGIYSKIFLNSEGSVIKTEGSRVMLSMNGVGRENNIIQYASERIGGYGYEVLNYNDVLNKGEEVKNRCLRLLRSKPCPKGNYTVILDPELTGVFIHESVGHAAEADLVLQNDSVFKDKIGEKVGSETVTVIDDPTIENSFGYYKYDDEGVVGKKTEIIKNGELINYLHTRETAGRLNMEPTGNGRAQGLSRPLVRMSNTFIKPNGWKFEELLEDTKNGIFLKGSRGGQVDTGKGLFQFNAVEAFEIKNGELTTSYRDAGLSGEILSILYSIDAITDEFKLSVGFCGKNGQSVPVGDGGGSIRTKTVLC